MTQYMIGDTVTVDFMTDGADLDQFTATIVDVFRSPGAQFLVNVAADLVSRLLDGGCDESGATEIAHNAPSVYTHMMWTEFVDLCAYEEDVSEMSDGTSTDADGLARIALYLIANRLVNTLMEMGVDDF